MNTEVSTTTTKPQPSLCTICVEPYNKRARLPISCPFCEFTACRTCNQTYVMGENTPKCMNPDCGKEWTLHFLREAFTNTFINTDLKTHREEVLFQQQIALLPATQPIVEREIQREEIREEIRKINVEIARLNNESNILWARYHGVGRMSSTNVGATRVEFVRNCPDTDCRGFLSSQWKCGICAKWTCPTCHEVKGLDRNAEHTCNPENVATAELLAQDTRHCPKCATPIFKIDGCDQMWCTQCQTGFSWRTGRIENTVHNPHYFEWLRRTGGQPERAAGDVVCGREITHRSARDFERLLFQKTREPVSRSNYTGAAITVEGRFSDDMIRLRHPNAPIAYERILTIIRSIIHLNHVDRGRYETNAIEENQDLRIAYMRNRLSSERFKSLLQQRNKKIHKHREILNIIDMVVNTTTDILYRFREYLMNSRQTECDIQILDEIDRIREYANECLHDISHTYGSVLLHFTDTLRMISTTGSG